MNPAIAELLRSPGVARVLSVLNQEEEEARIAGGAVRDALLGKIPEDVDFATTAEPATTERLAKDAGIRTVPTGRDHGTITFLLEGRTYEVTTLRRDVETDGRRAVVAFGRDWAEDARRRDLTINGLFLDRHGLVHDHVGGIDDLQHSRVRFIGNAGMRIREDYLRVLRFFRFFSRFADGPPDAEAMSAAIRERHGLRTLSRERVRSELLKLLVTRRASETMTLMEEAGLLNVLTGGVARLARLQRLAEIEAGTGRLPDNVLRLGALAVFTQEDVDRLQERLRLSRAETERLSAMAGTHCGLDPAADAKKRRQILYQLRPAAFVDGVLLGWAGSGAHADAEAWHDLLAFPQSWTPPQPPFRAEDFIRLGLPHGPRLGHALRLAERFWRDADFPDDAGSLQSIRQQAFSHAG
ncbi:CCA tRNA nucleotidyltransferase [Terrihabitans rhizophilus]|uniref:CCA tRNA nucleotidyltransferase n=1 Tax=Terrihabitans rhizophilus TaxID=3092662 RepID=A0ABU4RNH3_9HYPH|nr:CCA tRNA nucleotidyltransferase [Terrihabitans sp. PJ23]MDX6806372.1 CCA tRNA nucleotidyltransferase [Terrihabitans sp. PJ23]